MTYKNVLEITDIYERTTEFNNILRKTFIKVNKKNENNEFLYDKILLYKCLKKI